MEEKVEDNVAVVAYLKKKKSKVYELATGGGSVFKDNVAVVANLKEEEKQINNLVC